MCVVWVAWSFNLDEHGQEPALSVGLCVMRFIANRLMAADSDDSGCDMNRSEGDSLAGCRSIAASNVGMGLDSEVMPERLARDGKVSDVD